MQVKDHNQPATRLLTTHEQNEETLRSFGLIAQTMRERYNTLTGALDSGDWSAVRAALEKLGDTLRAAEDESGRCPVIQTNRLRHSLAEEIRGHRLAPDQEEALLAGIDRLLREIPTPVAAAATNNHALAAA